MDVEGDGLTKCKHFSFSDLVSKSSVLCDLRIIFLEEDSKIFLLRISFAMTFDLPFLLFSITLFIRLGNSNFDLIYQNLLLI